MSVRRMASVYEFADRLIVMADHRNDAGFWQAGEPVIRLPSSADDEPLGTAVRRAVDEAPAVVPATHWKERTPVLAKLAKDAGFRSWAPFDREARMCSFRDSDGGLLTIMPTRHGGTRGSERGFTSVLTLSSQWPVTRRLPHLAQRCVAVWHSRSRCASRRQPNATLKLTRELWSRCAFAQRPFLHVPLQLANALYRNKHR